MFVMDLYRRSGKGRTKAKVPFSPIANIEYFSRFFEAIALISRMMPELTPPHRPRSDVNGTSKVRVSALCSGRYLRAMSSPLNQLLARLWPKLPPAVNLAISTRIFAAATIFMALVILPMLDTDLIRALRIFTLTVPKPLERNRLSIIYYGRVDRVLGVFLGGFSGDGGGWDWVLGLLGDIGC